MITLNDVRTAVQVAIEAAMLKAGVPNGRAFYLSVRILPNISVQVRVQQGIKHTGELAGQALTYVTEKEFHVMDHPHTNSLLPSVDSIVTQTVLAFYEDYRGYKKAAQERMASRLQSAIEAGQHVQALRDAIAQFEIYEKEFTF